jgi:hypothetical protein
VIVVASNSGELLGGSSEESLTGSPEFVRILERDYVVDTVIGQYELLVRRDEQGVMLGGPPNPRIDARRPEGVSRTRSYRRAASHAGLWPE